MKKIKFLIAGVILSSGLFAQTTELESDVKEASDTKKDGWKKGGVFTLTFSQTALSNWAAGGQNSISANGLLSLFGNYKKGNLTWDNNLDIGYGMLKNEGEDLRKSDDKIELSSKVGKKASEKWYYAAMLNFRTQMAEGLNFGSEAPYPKISNALAPAYLIGAIGMDYKPSDQFTAFLAPLTGKITIVNDEDLSNAGAFGVDSGKVVRTEFGGYIRVAYTKPEVVKNVNFSTRLDLFSNYLNNPQNIDVNWETLIAMKVNKFLTVNLTTHLIYDDDIAIIVDDKTGRTGKRVQFKEVLGVGFSYKF